MRILRWPFCLACLWLMPGAALAEPPGQVEHRLSFPRLQQQYVRVASRFPVDAPVTELVMANWTPGSYLIREYAADLDGLVVRDSAGRPLPARKVRKNAWQVDTPGLAVIEVEYSVHAGELNVSTSWVGAEFVLINGATVFLYTQASRPMPQRVSVTVPAGLGRVYTPLTAQPGGGDWSARDFDELVDNPLVVAAASPLTFREGGHRYRFLNVGDARLWDTNKAVGDVEAIVRATNRLWGSVPLAGDYWFFNFLVEGRGGLEHDQSTVMMTSRWQMRKREDYVKWLGLVAHEYFHLWNVRRMRPAPLAVYDYEHEQYSAELWLAEGLTSYYDNLLLSRAGRVTPREYFQRLAEDLHRLELTPGRRVISLEQASRDAWIRHYRPDAQSINSTVSYYTKGAVVGLALDMHIRSETGDRLSLDDVMRAMYEKWNAQAYPPGAFRDELATLVGDGARDWLEPLIATPADPDIDAALNYLGLVLDRHPERTAAALAGAPVAAGFGVNWDAQSDRLIVASVIAGLAGSAAGLLPGDELLAIDGERVVKEDFDDRMLRLRPGEVVELLVARRGRLLGVELELAEARPATYEILLDPEISRQELRRLQDWLGQRVLLESDNGR